MTIEMEDLVMQSQIPPQISIEDAASIGTDVTNPFLYFASYIMLCWAPRPVFHLSRLLLFTDNMVLIRCSGSTNARTTMSHARDIKRINGSQLD
jgi:hypothetical protein